MPGLNSILNSIFGSSNERKLKKYKDQVHAINELEEKYENFSDEELKDKTFEFKELLKNKTKIEDITNDDFAIVREAAKRTLGQRHYDVQILGGLVLNKGNITEMKTKKYMNGKDILLDINLGIGSGFSQIWTCDLTEGYIKINADYRS